MSDRHNCAAIVFAIAFLISIVSYGQTPADTCTAATPIRFRPIAVVIPAALIGYGVIGLESHTLKDVNSGTKEEIIEHIDERLSLDDFSQYTPAAAVYAFNAFGLKGRNNFKDRTIILASASLMMGGTVTVLKKTGRVRRPDNSSNTSFPSGHTATAFMGAEFLYQEYKHVSKWIGVGGYIVAGGTGFFRMYNDRHWFTDVAAGAGIGMLSTKIAYWIQPAVSKMLHGRSQRTSGLIIPVYKNKFYGFQMALNF